MPPKLDSMAVSSSLDSIYISPRTPRTPRSARIGLNDNVEEVELSLLSDEERLQAGDGLGLADMGGVEYDAKRPISSKDKRGMVLLCVLCSLSLLPAVCH
jgi:hypothetical protein